jgi:hypothetical protein
MTIFDALGGKSLPSTIKKTTTQGAKKTQKGGKTPTLNKPNKPRSPPNTTAKKVTSSKKKVKAKPIKVTKGTIRLSHPSTKKGQKDYVIILKARDVEVTPHRAKYEDWESENGYFQVRVADEMKEVSFKTWVLKKKESLLYNLNGHIVLAASNMFNRFYCVVTAQNYSVSEADEWAEYDITLRETTATDPTVQKKKALEAPKRVTNSKAKSTTGKNNVPAPLKAAANKKGTVGKTAPKKPAAVGHRTASTPRKVGTKSKTTPASRQNVSKPIPKVLSPKKRV